MSKEIRTPDAMVGRSLSHYRLLEKLGEGGMGVVYRALDTHLDRQVAVKVLAAEAMLNPDRKRRFVQEAKTASALNHPNIVTIYDIDSAEGLDFIVMEYVRGKTLHQLIGGHGLRPGEALQYGVQIADALAATHAIGIVHRDIKPGNIMITEGQQTVKVLDFGLAKLADSGDSGDLEATETLPHADEPQTAEGIVFGTVAYMSPEQGEGKKVDARSDIFSFGSVLYEMLCGRRAFQGESKMSILAAVLREEPPPLQQVARNVPPELEEVIALCLRKDLRKRLQHMDDLRLLLENLKEKCEAGKLGEAVAGVPSRRRARGWVLAASLLVLLAVGIWWLARGGTPPQTASLSRLTWDAGLTQDPVLSPDGKLVAYASDRGGEGNLDIWVQQLSGGEPIRLTTDPADEDTPSFSPDSGRIAYHSDRGGGGIYVVSALGGQERLIVKGGQNPRFSPDGSRIVYWEGEPANFAPSGRVYSVAATGGKPVPIAPGFADARYAIWTPDGKHVLFQGLRSAAEEPEWWVVSAEGGDSAARTAVPTGALALLRRQGLSVNMGPGGFRDGWIVLSANAASARSLYQAPFSTRTWKVAGRVERLTIGSGLDAEPFPGNDGQMVFASLTPSNNLWVLPLDPQGRSGAQIQRLTEGAASDATPSCSRDGKKVVFSNQRYGNRDVWIKDLTTGREAAVTATPAGESSPVISADGSKIAYSVSGLATRPIYVVAGVPPPGSSVPEKACEDCGEPVDWAPDGNRILYTYGHPQAIGAFDVAARAKAGFLHHARYSLDQAQFSPDGAWISVLGYTDATHTRIFVLPVLAGTPVPEDRWIPVTGGESWDDRPRWSPDGNLIYFFSKRDGFGCIWKQALDRATKRPAGSPSPVHHFHSSRLSITHMALNRLGMSVAADKLVFNLVELTGSVWMLRSVPSRD